jgi:hypothetical protein
MRQNFLGDDLPTSKWMALRNRDLGGEAHAVMGLTQPALGDDLSMVDWLDLRDRQVRGLTTSAERPTVRVVRYVAAPAGDKGRSAQAAASRGPLTGRPGVAAVVAGALNTIAGGPNTSAPIRTGSVNGAVTRGDGQDIRGTARIFGIPRPLGARGTLNPPSGRKEIGVSEVESETPGLDLPDRVRIYNTPTGQLNIELADPITFGGFQLKNKGTWIIGAPDPRKKK